ncbi:hypothetical protein BAY61_18440 [Prauserella marina]|uniref:Uncharacterized protein n=1 Tax=Prauserella marina TaxID=530584 RepID=A0A222VRY0_9PSEU|nr:hypothetical protein [Prauserella marina]ASR36654.1 hypothetical protein BAY61_18440 [Prauserella marina]PWV74073.1 hypothetical protein DES30_108247 [Prauserella marina]SDD62346.1 hypothetical protein SAMN05421630_110248 [Prauserella marina]
MPNLKRPREARTLLELLIWERNQTFEEFVEFANEFARTKGEPGRLSSRHLARLAAGRGDRGRPLGRPLPATARLLERIFGVGLPELLAPNAAPISPVPPADPELRQLFRTSAKVDQFVLKLLQDQLGATRRLDRQLGALATRDEVHAKAAQVERFLQFSVTPSVRDSLAALVSELFALSGWQALDTGNIAEAWQQYTRARSAAAECGDPAYVAHSAAGQAFVLVELGDTEIAIKLLGEMRKHVGTRTSRLMRSWLAAAHGEVLAAGGRRDDSMRAFDRAQAVLPGETSPESGPYVVLDRVHLGRWRGHALARVGEPEAVDVLASSLDRLDPTFTRAETGLRVDLATALAASGEQEAAQHHAAHAERLAAEIGSVRQRRRVQSLVARKLRA